MWSTFVCSNLTMESLAFTRLCLHRVAKESERKVVREDGKGEGKRQKNRKFRVINSYKKGGIGVRRVRERLKRKETFQEKQAKKRKEC